MVFIGRHNRCEWALGASTAPRLDTVPEPLNARETTVPGYFIHGVCPCKSVAVGLTGKMNGTTKEPLVSLVILQFIS